MKLYFALFLLFSSLASKADTYTDEQTWVNLNAFIKMNEAWQSYIEYQPRFFDYSQNKGVTLHRGAIGRSIGHGMTAWAGYGFMTWDSRKNSKFPSKYQHEDRPFLMLTHSWVKENFKMTNRTRFEGRFFRHDDDPSYRFRHLIRAQYMIEQSPWAVAAWNEWFWNANSIQPSAASHAPRLNEGFDQNRAFFGIAYFFGEDRKHMFETGYMNNYVNGTTRDRNSHVWMTTISGNF